MRNVLNTLGIAIASGLILLAYTGLLEVLILDGQHIGLLMNDALFNYRVHTLLTLVTTVSLMCIPRTHTTTTPTEVEHITTLPVRSY
jgi:hypothetical protein